MARRTRILLADDHANIRAALRDLLDLVSGLEVVGEAANGREAVEMCDRLSPDVVIMDLRMPELDGIEATRIIKSTHHKTRIVAHSAYASPDLTQAMAEAGADDFIIKGTLSIDYLEALAA